MIDEEEILAKRKEFWGFINFFKAFLFLKIFFLKDTRIEGN